MRAAIAYRLLLGGKLNSLTNEQRCDWGRFLLSMQLRSPWALGELERLADQTLRANLERYVDPEYLARRKPDDPDTPYAWLEKHHPEVLRNAHKTFLPGLIDHDDLGQYLINMQWMTLDVSWATHSLLTSDRPFLHTLGWKDPRTTLLFPLSPRLLFVAANSDQRLAPLRRASPSRVVREANTLVADFAVDFVIGVDGAQLAFVEKRLRRTDQEPQPGEIGRGRPGCPQ